MKTILASFLALAACSSSGNSMGGDDDGSGGSDDNVSEADRQQDADDVATSIGANASTGELAANLDVVQIAYGITPAGLTRSAPNQVVGTRGGLDLEYDFYCRPVDELQDIPCDGLENHLHVKVTESGSIASADTSEEGLTRTANWTVRDVMVAKPRVDGKGHIELVSTMATGVYSIGYDDEYTRVRYTEAPTLPSAGTVDLTLTVDRTRDGASPKHRTFTVAAQIAVTGADTATLTLDGMQVYNLTLSTGAVVRAN